MENINPKILRLALDSLRRDFPNKSRSWIRRALRRLPRVRPHPRLPNVWIVEGDPSLGDRYPTYVVRLRPDGRYACSCFETPWGMRRKSEICTHIAAVMLWRRYHALLNEVVYADTITIKCSDYNLLIDKSVRDKVRMEKRVRVLNNDLINPLYEITYVIWSKEPMRVRAKVVCNEDIEEIKMDLKPTPRYMIEVVSEARHSQW
ncbi:hypothetical protein [Vulcanisaeta thermophila]|uniref:hypothetical protein n=1 Tax=Vulcanisaeta thermophila TaxID=867917 RepID=UPI000852E6B9|nr:hypothetical protein [Vulcanisaeta thermophila]